MRRRLTPKQDIFCREYVRNGGNGRAAYQLAYDTQASPETQRVKGCVLRRNPAVQARIKEFQGELAEAFDLTPESIMADMYRIAQDAPDPRTKLAALSQLGKWMGMEKPLGTGAGAQPVLDQVLISAMD